MSRQLSLTRARRTRTLSEDQVTRILQRGGMCLLSGGQWRVYRTQDKRSACVGFILAHVLERLAAQGDIRAARRQPNRRVWCGADMNAVAVTVLPVPESLRPRTGKRAARTALDAALAYETDDAKRIRLIAAARRYLADWEQAATPQSVTMQWGQSRVDGGRDVSRYDGPGGRAMAAGARLVSVQKSLSANQRRILDEITLRDASLTGLERRMCLAKGQGAEAAHTALCALACAYDLSVRAV